MIKDKPFLRMRWSHHGWLHQTLVRIYNRQMRLVPFPLKYGLGKLRRTRRLPYALIRPGSVVVQVGAPQDTLLAGRSRGMYFALLSHPSGRAIIMEPDAESARTFSAIAHERGLDHVTVYPKGAWSEPGSLRLRFDPGHPATNFIEGTGNYTPEQVEGFQKVDVPVETVDRVLAELGVTHVDLISITTNGSERRILEGMKATIASGLPYIALAATGQHYVELLDGLGYALYSYDDRGYTFKRRNA